MSVDVPIIGQVIEASAAPPYLCLRLDLDPSALGALILDGGPCCGAPRERSARTEPCSSDVVTPELLNAAVRLLRLLAYAARHRCAGAAGRTRNSLSPAAFAVRRAVAADRRADSKLQQVNRAIGWIKKNFREPFSIDSVGCAKRA